MLDIKFKINKEILVVIMCFCISVITFSVDSIQGYVNAYREDKDFYRSYQLEGAIYDIGENSVYTVVGDNASEKMLKRRAESNTRIEEFKSSQVFVVNNDSKKTYSNNGINTIEEFNKVTKDFPYILELNFKDKTLKKIEDGKKIDYITNTYGNIVDRRKEDVTTYIGIPSIKKIKESDYDKTGDRVNLLYRENIRSNREAMIFLGSRIIAVVVLLSSFLLYINNRNKMRKNYKNNEDYIEQDIKQYKLYSKLKSSKIFNLEGLFVIGIILLILSYMFMDEDFYILFNTILLLDIYYFIYTVISTKNTDELINKSKIFRRLYKNKRISQNEIVIIRFVILFTVIQILLLFSILYTIYGIRSSGSIPSFIIDMFTYNKNIILMFIGIVLGNLLLASTIIKKMRSITYIQTSLNEFKSGNFNHKIEVNENDMFNELVENINSLGEVINESVEERLKSERMKTELITNVSHDLKTPLTAIINYISLMKKEDIKPEHVKDYVKVLDNRTQKLKVLIDDLFEASKVSSNDIEINLEKTDINQLLTQSIVEMEKEIEKVKLDFIINTPDEEVYIMADGIKLWRVFENLISNILKYSLEGTRVYIDMITKDNKVNITMKNISNYPLNFNPKEITERFTRGDLSRNTEGSGLGLSIAKGFVELQDGNLDIEIIGDLFIVTLIFDLVK
ncbi:HAMP domain-containing sensor histidine kinase [[Clostridium] dakarense]|uniref:HAMP domain-containing sensor histidine kinase n=1 Tax=Faecalimicrobium dakarense TaxID=1301100 RepID=UPI0011CCC58B|nr:sensor histidine kinase [[Clostridium] dakarense]